MQARRPLHAQAKQVERAVVVEVGLQHRTARIDDLLIAGVVHGEGRDPHLVAVDIEGLPWALQHQRAPVYGKVVRRVRHQGAAANEQVIETVPVEVVDDHTP